MAALLTSVGDNKDKSAVYLAECRRLGIKVLPPDVNESALRFGAVGTDIRFGLGAIRNVGANVVESIIKSRKEKGAYTSFTDFMDKSELVACNKRVIESLIKAGAFDAFGHPRLSLIQVHEDAVDAVVPIKRKEAEGQFDLFGGDSADDQDDSSSPLAHLKFGAEEYPRKQMLSLEKEMLGLYVSSHPLDGAERILRKYAPRPIAVVLDDPPKEGELIVSGMISSIERRVNKNGLPWAITVIEDLDASIEVLFFPKSYEVLRDDLELDSAVCIKGRVNWRDDKMAIFGDGVVPLDISDAEANPGADPPLVLGLHTKTLTPELIEELKSVFKTHEGQVAVHLEVQKRDKSKEMMVVGNFRVNTTPSLFGDLKTIRGITIHR